MTADPAPEPDEASLPERALLTPPQDLGPEELRRIADLLRKLPDQA